MVFSSGIFLFLFLPGVLLIHFLLPSRFRNLWLLMASLFFYAWGEVVYSLIMLASIAINYTFGMLISRQLEHRNAKTLVRLAVGANLLLLIVFKYANFIAAQLNCLLTWLGLGSVELVEPIHLPIGISFYTFQAMSYVIDVYRGEVEVQRNPLKVGLYITLFPQLIAGPIVRYRDVAAQILSRSVRFADFAYGVRRFIIGLGKKVLIANTLAGPADKVFSCAPENMTPAVAWFGVACYAMQIYFDFSGYSDMAIGLGRMLGFRFLENFNYPYIARSMTEFWRRWHISLTTWFRDYLYVPLGGNRSGALRTYMNLLTVFLLCGLWHGASWNFALWGLFHGMFLIIERMKRDWHIPVLLRPLAHVYVIFICLISWTFFRADTLANAFGLLCVMFGIVHTALPIQTIALVVDHEIAIVFLAGIIISTPVITLAGSFLRDLFADPSSRIVAAAQIAISSFAPLVTFAGILLLAVLKVAAGTHNPFIYFRF
jgi:alginate O-acetyltransferase complex protein AlgI